MRAPWPFPFPCSCASFCTVILVCTCSCAVIACHPHVFLNTCTRHTRSKTIGLPLQIRKEVRFRHSRRGQQHVSDIHYKFTGDESTWAFVVAKMKATRVGLSAVVPWKLARQWMCGSDSALIKVDEKWEVEIGIVHAIWSWTAEELGGRSNMRALEGKTAKAD